MCAVPPYHALYASGLLQERIEALAGIQKECELCPRRCRAARAAGEVGVCGAGDTLVVSSAFPHFGEESPLTGRRGSGTIFLAHCNLKCLFCQNYDISHCHRGTEVTIQELAEMALGLQRLGCHNINFVTPTHFAPQIVAALPAAIDGGLDLPIVWNCGGYESLEVIRLLEGIVDIYMPDVKFMSAEAAARYCDAPDYPGAVRAAVAEMHRQVGDLQIDGRGIARRGLLVRHLVMPGWAADTREVLRFLAEEISPNTYVNIMDQYRPMFRAGEFAEINRRIHPREWAEAVAAAKSFGLGRGF